MIRQATYADLMTFYQAPVPAYVLERDGQVCACGGLLNRDGRVWAYFDVGTQVTQGEAFAMMKALRRGLAAIGQDVYIVCDHSFATAPRLLRALGFEPTDETFNEHGVWICRV
jgi:hypothetical protein